MLRTILCVLLLILPTQLVAATNWNENNIKWLKHDDGIDTMKRENKRGIVIIYSNSCGVCVRYSRMFYDSDVVENSADLVMIKIDRDLEERLAEKYQVDGGYVPRTYLLNSDGSIIPSPYRSDKYKFYLPPNSEKYLAAIMQRMSHK